MFYRDEYALFPFPFPLTLCYSTRLLGPAPGGQLIRTGKLGFSFFSHLSHLSHPSIILLFCSQTSQTSQISNLPFVLDSAGPNRSGMSSLLGRIASNPPHTWAVSLTTSKLITMDRTGAFQPSDPSLFRPPALL